MRTHFKENDWICVQEHRAPVLLLWLADEDGTFHGSFKRHANYADFSKLKIRGSDGRTEAYDQDKHGTVFVSPRMTLTVGDEQRPENAPGKPIVIPTFPMPVEEYMASIDATGFRINLYYGINTCIATGFGDGIQVSGKNQEAINAISFLADLLEVAHDAARGVKSTKKKATDVLRQLHQIK